MSKSIKFKLICFFALFFVLFSCQGLGANQESCKLQRTDPWLLKKFFVRKPYVYCKERSSLVNCATVNETTVCFLDKRKVEFYKNVGFDINCCASNISRPLVSDVPDKNILRSPCLEFTDGEMTIRTPIVNIRCFKTQNETTSNIYENFHAFHNPNFVDKQTEKTTNTSFNVLLIGIRSVSKQNAIRALPRTHYYLTNSGWTNFNGFNAIGNATLSTIIPMLTGYSMDGAERKFKSPWGDYYDNYEFVWGEYQNKGYYTSFAEDHPKYSLFNRKARGFIAPPTDFYFRPYGIALNLLEVDYLDGMPHCVGHKNVAERFLSLILDLSESLKQKPHFGLFFLNTFSAEDINAPARMDAKLKEFFESLSKTIERNTFAIFFSDRGFQKYDLAASKAGWIEARSPLLYIRAPDEFKEKFQEEYLNLLENSLKLVSPFDLYATLLDILQKSEGTLKPIHVEECEHCRSLLSDIPASRTCAEASISHEFCLCTNDVVVVINNPKEKNATYLRSPANSAGIIRFQKGVFAMFPVFLGLFSICI